jgi:predicted methyltransferase
MQEGARLKTRLYMAVAALAAAGAVTVALAQEPVPPNIAAAVANPDRPQADRDRDAARKPAEVLTFAGVQPGEQVLELIPGGGYFTRLLSVSVGPGGHVTELVPQMGSADAAGAGVPASPQFPNVSVGAFTPDAIAKAGPVDLVWTSQNYHDLHLTRLKLDVVGLDKQIFAALKPGGIFFIEDHAAQPGTGISTTDQMHRIDEDFVKHEVESVGFTLVGESDVLRNPADTHTVIVFDKTIRGHTDQFLLKFQKPA